MPKVFHGPHKNPPALPPTYLMYGPLDFPLGYWTWVVKYKANYFGWKITRKVLKLTSQNSSDDLDL